MAYIQDSSQSFTISLTALLEGIGFLSYIGVYNTTQMIDSEWFDGMWQTPLPEAVEADSIDIYVEVYNEGATTDTLFAEFVSAQVTPVEPLIQEMPNVIVGGVDGVGWNFSMPPSAVNITINAGHVE